MSEVESNYRDSIDRDFASEAESEVNESSDEKTPLKSTGGVQKSLVERLTQLLPYFLKFWDIVDDVFDFILPYVHKAMEEYEKLKVKLEPYNPDALFKMASGFSMMFFGGFFISTVAVVEAVLQAGSDRLVKNLYILKQQVDLVQEANAADDKLDEDNDGIADVKQISKEKLTYRKMLVVLKACNPEAMNEALSALYTILIAVIATLRVRFARTVSLGASIGIQISNPVLKFVIPVLKDVLPQESHKWLVPVSRYICRAIGVSIAFALERILSTVHTAIRGAYVMTAGFTKFAESRGMSYLSDGYADDMFSFAMAGMGIYAQLFVWRSLPMLIKILLFPAFGTEWLLTTFITFSV